MNKCNDIIDLTESDTEETIDQVHTPLVRNLETAQNLNYSVLDDGLHLIKENLQLEGNLSCSMLTNLSNLKCDQHTIFSLLSELNFEELFNFGISLKTSNACNDFVVSYYIRYLLEKVIKLLLK